jgi:hypothetical protein
MRLSTMVLRRLEDHSVETFHATRETTRFWNEHRSAREPRFFCGWYWYSRHDTHMIHGPFKTWSAACRDAYIKMVLRSNSLIDHNTLIDSPKRERRR